MELPIYIGGREAGRLLVAQEGLYTRLTADCGPGEGLVRLWLHGGGRCVYLGLLVPEDGRLRLSKRLSRAALPPELAYAADSEQGLHEPEPEKPAAGPEPSVEAPAAPGTAAAPEISAEAAPPVTLPKAGDAAQRQLLLPCRPGVPGAVKIGGRWVLVISLVKKQL